MPPRRGSRTSCGEWPVSAGGALGPDLHPVRAGEDEVVAVGHAELDPGSTVLELALRSLLDLVDGEPRRVRLHVADERVAMALPPRRRRLGRPLLGQAAVRLARLALLCRDPEGLAGVAAVGDLQRRLLLPDLDRADELGLGIGVGLLLGLRHDR